MSTPSDPFENEEDLLADFLEQKNGLLQKYKALKTPLEFAEDDFEAGEIQKKMDALATEIRMLSQKIRELESR